MVSLTHLPEGHKVTPMPIQQKDGHGGPCPNRGRTRRNAEWCPWCYVNIRGRERFKGHIGYHAVRQGYVPWESIIMKRPDSAGHAASTESTPCQCSTLAKFTSVCEYLTTAKWDDGSPREPSKLSVSVQDGCVLIALNDVDLKQSCYTSSTSLQDGLKLLDKALKDSSVTWRPWKAGTRKK